MVIQTQIQGLAKLQKKLQDKTDQIQNLQPFWENVGMYVQKQTIKERFDKEQSPEGTKWKPLAPATIKHRLRRNKTGNIRILADTGELRRSVRYMALSNGVMIGSNLKYARVHQFGGRHIPKRPYLGVTLAEQKYITQMLSMYIRRHFHA